MVRVSFQAQIDTLKRLLALARERNWSAARAIRAALETYLKMEAEARK